MHAGRRRAEKIENGVIVHELASLIKRVQILTCKGKKIFFQVIDLYLCASVMRPRIEIIPLDFARAACQGPVALLRP